MAPTLPGHQLSRAGPWLHRLVRSSSLLPASTQIEILQAEEGQYVDGVWRATRILNGDQTDRGLNFRSASPPLVRIRLHKLPLYDQSVHRHAQ